MPFHNVDEFIGWLGVNIKHNHTQQYAEAKAKG